MGRIFKPLVERKCTVCMKILPGDSYTHCKRTNKNEVVYYQRSDCKLCRNKKEQVRRAENNGNKRST